MISVCYYTKHHLKYGKNQADNLEYIGFRRRFFPVFYWCLVLVVAEKLSVGMALAKALGVTDKKDGYIEGNNLS